MIPEVLVVLIIVWYIAFHIRRTRLYKLAAKFNGPTPLPFLGNALKCLMPISEMQHTLLNGVGYYKSPIRFWFGSHLIIYLSNPEAIKIILNSSHAMNKFTHMYALGENFVGRGLVTLPAEIWKRHRRLIAPNFSQQNLEGFSVIFCKRAKVLADNLKSKVGEGAFDVDEYLKECTLNNVFETVLGFKLDECSSISAQYISQLIKQIVDRIQHRMSNILYYPNCIYNWTTSGKKFMEVGNEYNGIISLIIEKWKNGLVKNHMENKENVNDAEWPSSRTFVENLLFASDEADKLSSEELLEEVKTMIGVGFDTTASTMGFLLLLLGIHEDVQEKVFEEIENTVGSRSEIHYKDLKNFVYLERVIKETLRLFPVLSGIARTTDREITLDEKHVIPANTTTFIGIYTLHRDPILWPQPEKFNPDRFLPEQVALRHPYSWIPFSAGPRNCIGLQFAMLSLKMITIHLVKSFKIKTPFKNVEDIRQTSPSMPKCIGGFQISITPR